MATRAVSARKERLAPLVDLALLAALVATPTAAIWVGVATSSGLLGLLAGAGGAGVVFLIGRTTLGAKLTLSVASATWVALAIACFIALAVLLGNCAPNTSDPWAPWAGMGVVYVGLGLWSLRTGRSLWGLPLAVALAFAVGLALVFTLPGTPGVCD